MIEKSIFSLITRGIDVHTCDYEHEARVTDIFMWYNLCIWSCKLYFTGKRDVELLKTFALEETEKAATKAQLENDAEL